jgi:hypothetical protein
MLSRDDLLTVLTALDRRSTALRALLTDESRSLPPGLTGQIAADLARLAAQLTDLYDEADRTAPPRSGWPD